MSFEDQTQRLSAPPRVNVETTTRLPRPLDLAGPGPDDARADDARLDDTQAGATSELSLDEIFEAEAPATTGMPVIPVRSEPLVARPSAASTTSQAPQAAPAERRDQPGIGDRLRHDASAAWSGAVRRSSAWLARDDNGLMLMTALVACILILVVAAVG